ncbi:hypothetical protein [Streptomyces sp. NPDC016845]|uniref:hypothetical protein n=1 Tax=Streptomyces sp. NPDC016845 TaxID=3364972 RepID=UPI0037922096
MDASSCTLGIAQEVTPYLTPYVTSYLTPENLRKHQSLTVVDPVVWAATELMPRLTVTNRSAAPTSIPPAPRDTSKTSNTSTAGSARLPRPGSAVSGPEDLHSCAAPGTVRERGAGPAEGD